MLKNEDVKSITTLLYSNDKAIKTTVLHAIANSIANAIITDSKIKPNDYGIVAKKKSYYVNELAIVDRPLVEKLINDYIKVRTGNITKLPGVRQGRVETVSTRILSNFLDTVGVGQLFSKVDMDDIDNNMAIYVRTLLLAHRVFSNDED